MIRIAYLLLPLAAAWLLAGCGGADDSTDSKSSDSRQRRIDRTGYFTETESRKLNPALAEWNTAVNDGIAANDRCNANATRLYEEGKPGPVVVACHRKETRAVLAAIDGLQEAIDSLQGNWRAPCESGIAAATSTLDSMERAWKALDADWVAYASNRPAPKLAQHSKATDVSRDRFRNEDIPAWTKACYTKADIDAAEQESKGSGGDTTS